MLLDHLDVSVPLACRRFSWDSGRTRRNDDIGVGMTRRHGLVDEISIIATVRADGGNQPAEPTEPANQRHQATEAGANVVVNNPRYIHAPTP